MNQFKNLNNIIGWSVFLIASFVYLSTIEQTVSFWDCGEYIATAYKLEVGHPPGAPLFQLFGRIFTLFAAQGTSEVAVAINILSALCSSFSILFLFWTITAFGRKMFFKDNNYEIGKIFAVLGSGLVGALAYTFSDSFWFSAVEGEVYAMSSFFTAITFWCIMKWEQEANKPNASRWLVLIAYLIGLSVGVHLLSLLTIPAMGMIYYYKKYDYTKSGAIKAFIISMIMLGVVQAVIIPGAVSLISTFELFFVNTIGLPFNSGTIIYFLTIIGAIAYGLSYTKKHNKAVWNTAILGVMMLLIGYSSYAILVVRSNANPPIDENNPEDAVGLLSYLNRDQYGSWPIVYGQHFNAKLDSRKPYLDGKPVYAKDEKKGKYVVIDKRKNTLPNYSKKDKMFFPRIWSNTQTRHAGGYVNWAGLKNKNVNPTFAENMTYFFKYQIGWSYIRYFMWNFAGRQNDFMNMDGNSLNGNWESGIGFIDNARLGTPSAEVDVPDYLGKNKGKNHYYFLPLILGLIGMLFHFKQNNQDALA
ncbi:MAG: glycosyltransferase family 117 protein, partial [Flavobacteriales bacterium]